MPKLVLNDITNLQNEAAVIDAINENSADVEDAVENTISRDGTSPNQMEADLDMNSNRILNLPLPLNDHEPLRLIDAADFAAGGTFVLDQLPAGGDEGQVLVKDSDTDFDVAWGVAVVGVVNAKTDYGAVGDGVVDDTLALQAAIDGAFLTCNSLDPSDADGAGHSIYEQKKLFIPNGKYKITSPLVLNGKWGIIIEGAGRQSTTIINETGTGVFVSNGLRDSTFSDMLLLGDDIADGGVLFEYDWDGSNFVNSTSVTFRDMMFGSSEIGVRAGNTGFQSDNAKFYGCQWGGCGTGFVCANFNSLGHGFYGGQFQACTLPIDIVLGSIPTISGIEFQLSTDFDIRIQGSAGDCCFISGCRSEGSDNFIDAQRAAVHLSCCSHLGVNNGIFLATGYHPVTITSCISTKGQITGNNVAVSPFNQVIVNGCEFGRSDWTDGNVIAYVSGTNVGSMLDSGVPVTQLRDGIWNGDTFLFSQRTADLTDAVNIATDLSLGRTFRVTLGGNRTLDNPTNTPDGLLTGTGGSYYWIIEQDGTGNRTLAFGNMFIFPGGVAPGLSTDAGAIDVVIGVYDKDDDVFHCQFIKGAPNLFPLVDAANVATDAARSDTFSVTLTANRTLSTPTNLVTGRDYVWRITQDGVGGRTLSYSTSFKFPGGPLSLSTAAAAVDVLRGRYDGTNVLSVLTKAYST